MTKIIRLSDKEPIYIELYDALAHFLGRQQFAARVITDLGVNPAELAKGVGGWFDKTPGRGTWGEIWRFAFHGGGCLLKHMQTGEPVDLNTPDPSRISLLSFIYHLEWRVAHEDSLPMLRTFIHERTHWAVLELIDELVADGFMTSDYRLTPLPDSSQASAA